MRRLVPLLVLVLAATACGDGASETTTGATTATTSASTSDASTSNASTSDATTSTEALSTTTSPVSTTTTVPATTSTPDTAVAAAPSPFGIDPSWAQPQANSGGANGSGCMPGSGPLPDGVWFGFATAFAPEPLTFDLACLWFGDAAWEAAAEDGEEAPNDVYIRNENPALRTVVLEPDTPTHRVDWTGALELVITTWADWPSFHGTGGSCPDWCPVWLIVDQGVVTDVVEQYLP